MRMAFHCLDLVTIAISFCICSCQVINRPPSLHQTFEPSYYIQRDHSIPITIHCKAQNGNITYQWKKDDVAVRNSRQVAVDPKLGTIVFTRIDMSVYGTYQCFASNQYGTALSPPIEIHEARLGSFPADSFFQACTKFQHCPIQCWNRPVCEPESQCRIQWKIGPGTDNNVRLSERVAVDGKGNLHILSVTDEDWNGQQYGCGLWNDLTKTLTKGSMTFLSIKDSSLSRIEPLGVYSENTKAFLGQTAELQCIFSGSPIPTIQWKTPELEFIDISNTKKYELADFGRKLLVKNLTINDEGSYTCIANNKVQQQAFLNVTSPPFINPLNKNPQMADTYISAGKNAVFYCDPVSVQGEKPPSPPIWKKNGKDIGANRVSVEYFVSPDMRELTVLDTEKPSSSRAGSTGSYQCVSSNSEGMIFNDAFLAVLDPIKILIRPENSYLIDRESVISLAVDASTDPALSLQYRWIRNSNNQTTLLTSNTNPRAWTLSDSNRNLTINAQGLNKDEFFQLIGRYFVEIYHQYDAEFVHIDVGTDIPANTIKILIRPENSYLIDRESVISLAVDASTDPALSLQYRWIRNSNNQTTLLTSNTNPRAWTLSDSNRNLTINAQGLNKDEFFQLIGRYFVEIYHQYDAEFVHIDVGTDIPAIVTDPVPTRKEPHQSSSQSLLALNVSLTTFFHFSVAYYMIAALYI